MRKAEAVLAKLSVSSLRQEHFRKTTLTIPEGSEIVLPPLTSQAGITFIEVHQKPHSKLHMTYLQNGATGESNMIIFRCFLGEGAHLDAWNGMFGGSYASLLLETHLSGAGSSVQQRTAYFADSNQVFDIFSTTIQEAPACSALIESRGILNERAEARFDGSITIQEKARMSDAKLLEHMLLLSPEAKMNATPGLMIETNDVTASHAASMTRIDDEQLFYCKSRGLTENEARRLIVEGFLKSIYAEHQNKKMIYTLIREKVCKL